MTAIDAGVTARPLSDRQTDILVGAVVGLASFLTIVGPAVLDVTNMLWLTQDIDSFTHYIGWEFFRRSPWTWPLGMSPDYGLQFSSSIIFSDSIPLLAIPLKLLSPLLPKVFQYSGWWVFSCFLLQAYFAARIAGLFTRDTIVKLALATLVTFAPPFLWRLSIHYSLVAHWLILAGLYLYWAPNSPRRSLSWIVLLTGSVLIHTYFFGMLVPIWLASLVRRQLLDRSSPWLLEGGMVIAAALAGLWTAGFFPLRSSMLSVGYGYFRLNLVALINPQGSNDMGGGWAWSAFLPTMPRAFGDYEGFAYAGLGGLGAAALALPLVLTERRSYRGKGLWPLVVVAILLTLFAISPNVAITDRGAPIPVPQIVFDVASLMRASGRFFWPVYYMIPLGAAWLLLRTMGLKYGRPLLVLLAMLQVYDISPGWMALRSQLALAGPRFETSIDDPRLAEVAKHYKAVRALPPATMMRTWEQIAYFALRVRLPTDAAYLARTDDAALKAFADAANTDIAEHRLDPDALYFLSPDFATKVATAMTPADAMFHIGDFYVYAPGWHAAKLSTTLAESRPQGSPATN